MAVEAKIIQDSISPQGLRLTTFEVTHARIVLAEANTHRMITKSSASSRAIPVSKMMARVDGEPFIPSHWGVNQSGMQAAAELEGHEREVAIALWLEARDAAMDVVKRMQALNIHKQITNRLLEPFMWHTAIYTATEWSNFFNLRADEMAHPDIQLPARAMIQAYQESTPVQLKHGEWHLPYIHEIDREEAWDKFGDHTLVSSYLAKISTARCARVSYLTHDGVRDHKEDIKLHDKILSAGHMAPFEHPARPMTPAEYYSAGNWITLLRQPDNDVEVRNVNLPKDVPPSTVLGDQVIFERWGAFCGNFNGWVQCRKLIPGEFDIRDHQYKQIRAA